MHGAFLTSLSVLASVAAAAPSPEHKTRATKPWIATGAAGYLAGHGLVGGAAFDISVEAGNIPDSPAFDVHCEAFYVYSGAAEGGVCTWKGPQPAYSEVLAYTDYDTLAVTVKHQWLAADGYRRVSSAVGTLPSRPQYQVTEGPFELQVSDSISTLPGLIGNFGTWSATHADFVRDSAGRLRGMQYKLSAPAGYAPDAPAFDVSCYYDYNPDATVFPVCTPTGAAAAGSTVSLWATVAYNYTIVHHEWTAANGTKYQLVGTSGDLSNLGQITAFTIKPDVLNTL